LYKNHKFLKFLSCFYPKIENKKRKSCTKSCFDSIFVRTFF
jgi:hypothetical protein